MRNAIDNGASRNDAHIDFHFSRRARRVRDGGSATRSSAATRTDHDRARSISSACLIWDIVNTGYQPVTLTNLIVHGRNGANDDTVPLGLPETLCYHERIRVASDADWALLSARSIVAVDDAGIEYRAPDRQLDVVQDPSPAADRPTCVFRPGFAPCFPLRRPGARLLHAHVGHRDGLILLDSER